MVYVTELGTLESATAPLARLPPVLNTVTARCFKIIISALISFFTDMGSAGLIVSVACLDE